MIALVDCNNFFVSCERLFRPDLAKKPVLVLSSNDGCVVARSNEVKALGVPMGIPYFKVKDIVEQNQVVCFSSNFSLYSNISQRINQLLRSYAPLIETYSIDEAFIDLTGLNLKNYDSWARDLVKAIDRQVGMPVSVGIAPTKTLAKLASEYAKKHTQTCIIEPRSQKLYQAILEYVAVEDVWGIGRRLAPKFTQAGIHNAWQLTQVSQAWIHTLMGIKGTQLLSELRGEAVYSLEDEPQPQKSLVVSRSFGHTITTYYELEVAVANFATQAAAKLRHHEQHISVFGVFLRYRTKEKVRSSQSAVASLLVPSNDTGVLVKHALQLLSELYDSKLGYKKAGVFAYQLTSAALCQLNMFDTQPLAQKIRRQKLMHTLDAINQRFGSQTVHVGTIDPTKHEWKALKQKMSPAYVSAWSDLPLVYA